MKRLFMSRKQKNPKDFKSPKLGEKHQVFYIEEALTNKILKVLLEK